MTKVKEKRKRFFNIERVFLLYNKFLSSMRESSSLWTRIHLGDVMIGNTFSVRVKYHQLSSNKQAKTFFRLNYKIRSLNIGAVYD